jgi:glucose-1-phosphate adenylyltransferase
LTKHHLRKNILEGWDYLKGSPDLPDMDNNMLTVKDGIVVVKKGAMIPEGFRLGK